MLNQAVILCGGLGSRLGKLTSKTPKPLLKVNKKPFIEYQIENLARHYIKKIFLICCYKSYLFNKKYHNKKIKNAEIICIDEKTPLGTGGGLMLIKNKLDTNFLVLNGDTIFDINYLDFYNKSKKSFYLSIAVTNNLGKRYDGINNSKLRKNAGVYLCNKKIFRYYDKKVISLEKDIFPKLSKIKKIQTIFYEKDKHNFLDIGIPSDFKLSHRKIIKSHLRPAAFLDRDGVINEDYGYVHKISNFKWKNGIFELIKFFNDINYLVFVISNQSGIGRGYYSKKVVDTLHNWVQNQLNKKGSHIDKFYIAPYYWRNKKYTLRDKKLRKPNTGMIDLALKEWKIDKKRSIIIGDQESDRMLAQKSNIKFYKIDSRNTIKNIIKKLKSNK
ncbi:HAD-IIIA family hydrolase [Candidatus Pelagibacter sp.]|jgi:D,D-heptose 1,7-bisphosphate phosphatase|nr:HAD-IIIA family hydrolase [Candidatus Pelagibacter sp.]